MVFQRGQAGKLGAKIETVGNLPCYLPSEDVVIQPIDQTIAETITEPGVERGASLLIAEDGRFLVAARPPISVNSRVLINLTGIGGWLEADETFAEAVQREAIEETGSRVKLLDLSETLLVRSPEDIEEVCIVGEAGPAAIVYCRLGAPPFDPWSDEYAGVVAVTVFTGTLTERPRIVAPDEHPFFLWLYPEQLITLSDCELPLDYLIADGAELFGEYEGDISRAVARLTDSIPSLLTALGAAAFSFLGDIARLTQPPRVE